MRTQHYLALFVVLSMFIFAVWDVWAFKAGKMTLSRWVIKESKKRRWAAWLALAFCLFVILLGFWLLQHWFLPCALFNIWCGWDI